jgi:hypothetical protein
MRKASAKQTQNKRKASAKQAKSRAWKCEKALASAGRREKSAVVFALKPTHLHQAAKKAHNYWPILNTKLASGEARSMIEEMGRFVFTTT